jgi:hypothetical protein
LLFGPSATAGNINIYVSVSPENDVKMQEKKTKDVDPEF